MYLFFFHSLRLCVCNLEWHIPWSRWPYKGLLSSPAAQEVQIGQRTALLSGQLRHRWGGHATLSTSGYLTRPPEKQRTARVTPNWTQTTLCTEIHLPFLLSSYRLVGETNFLTSLCDTLSSQNWKDKQVKPRQISQKSTEHHIAVLVVNYGISNTFVLEIP